MGKPAAITLILLPGRLGALYAGLMVRSLPKRSAGKRLEPWAARVMQQQGHLILRDAILRIAPQDEAERASNTQISRTA